MDKFLLDFDCRDRREWSSREERLRGCTDPDISECCDLSATASNCSWNEGVECEDLREETEPPDDIRRLGDTESFSWSDKTDFDVFDMRDPIDSASSSCAEPDRIEANELWKLVNDLLLREDRLKSWFCLDDSREDRRLTRNPTLLADDADDLNDFADNSCLPVIIEASLHTTAG